MHRPPFRADHIGSLLRPQALRQAYRAFNDRALDEADFVAAQDAAIRDAIALQADAGLAVVTDGEFRRASYWSRFVERTIVEGAISLPQSLWAQQAADMVGAERRAMHDAFSRGEILLALVAGR